MENLNQESVNGSNYENEQSSNENPCEPESMRKLFIGGLDYRTTNDSLQCHFEKYGTVVDVVVMKDPITKRSRGFGFITYSCSSMVDDAQAARPHSIDGRVVEAKRAVPRDDANRPEAGAAVKKVYISGINDDHEAEDLRQYFGQFGNVTNVNIVCDKENGKRRGFAFVEFDDYDPVDKVVLQKAHNVKGKILNVNKAISKMHADRGNSIRGDGNNRLNQYGNVYNNSYGGNNRGNNGNNWSNADGNSGNLGVGCTNGWNGNNNGWNRNNNGWNGNNNGWNGNNNGWAGNNNEWNSNNGLNGSNGFSNFRNFGGDNITFGGNSSNGTGDIVSGYQGGFNGGAMRNNFSGNNRMNPYSNGNFGGRNTFNQGNVVGGRRSEF